MEAGRVVGEMVVRERGVVAVVVVAERGEEGGAEDGGGGDDDGGEGEDDEGGEEAGELMRVAVETDDSAMAVLSRVEYDVASLVGTMVTLVVGTTVVMTPPPDVSVAVVVVEMTTVEY
jgi:hypothetical protein